MWCVYSEEDEEEEEEGPDPPDTTEEEEEEAEDAVKETETGSSGFSFVLNIVSSLGH